MTAALERLFAEADQAIAETATHCWCCPTGTWGAIGGDTGAFGRVGTASSSDSARHSYKSESDCRIRGSAETCISFAHFWATEQMRFIRTWRSQRWNTWSRRVNCKGFTRLKPSPHTWIRRYAASRKCWLKWEFPRFKVTAARKFLKRSGSTRPSWTAISPALHTEIGGIGLDVIAEETLMRHERAYGNPSNSEHALDSGSDFQWRRGGQYHKIHGLTVYTLQQATRRNDYAEYKRYSQLVDREEWPFCATC